MKFVDFGDLVEVTYDDERVELISKEEALALGYKTAQEIKITYQGQTFNSEQFSKFTKIGTSVIKRYYHKGLTTGEEIITAYNQQKDTKQDIQITYKKQIFNSIQFSKLTKINAVTVLSYYNKGLRTGEEIIHAYNKQKETIQDIQITYKGEIYNCSQFSKLIGMNHATIRRYYNKGLRAGEDIIRAYNKQKETKQDIRITFQGKTFNSSQFSRITEIPVTTIIIYYNKGLHTGEEIVAFYNLSKLEDKRIKFFITHNNIKFSVSQFSAHSGISQTAIRSYIKNGITSGEEMLAQYAQNTQYKNKR